MKPARRGTFQEISSKQIPLSEPVLKRWKTTRLIPALPPHALSPSPFLFLLFSYFYFLSMLWWCLLLPWWHVRLPGDDGVVVITVDGGDDFWLFQQITVLCNVTQEESFLPLSFPLASFPLSPSVSPCLVLILLFLPHSFLFFHFLPLFFPSTYFWVHFTSRPSVFTSFFIYLLLTSQK